MVVQLTNRVLPLCDQDKYFYIHRYLPETFMNPGRIHPGSLIFLGYLFLLLAACSGKKINSLKPEGYENQKLLTIEKGNLKGFFVDNTAINPAHKEGYNGLGQLYHAEEDSGIFVPAFAGFNFEHIFGGDSLEQLFEPRRYPMTLYRKTGDEVLLYQEETPLSGVESLTSFKLVAPHYIDVTFQCILHKSEFFRHGYAGLFWASYIRNPDDKKIYFKGVSENDPVGSTSWIPAWSPEHGVKSTHRSVKDDHDFFFSENFNASLANHSCSVRQIGQYARAKKTGVASKLLRSVTMPVGMSCPVSGHLIMTAPICLSHSVLCSAVPSLRV